EENKKLKDQHNDQLKKICALYNTKANTYNSINFDSLYNNLEKRLKDEKGEAGRSLFRSYCHHLGNTYGEHEGANNEKATENQKNRIKNYLLKIWSEAEKEIDKHNQNHSTNHLAKAEQHSYTTLNPHQTNSNNKLATGLTLGVGGVI
ncbi:10037_t:CDS:2, partial [Ambispora gerdemannii]